MHVKSVLILVAGLAYSLIESYYYNTILLQNELEIATDTTGKIIIRLYVQ